MNQEIETALRCLVFQNLSTWSQRLLWMGYAHISLTCSTTGFSPFQCVYSYQAPLFLAQESEVTCQSARAFIRRLSPGNKLVPPSNAPWAITLPRLTVSFASSRLSSWRKGVALYSGPASLGGV